MAPTDPWLVLGLEPGSSLADARAARRRLAKQLHPDVHTSRPPAELAELSAQMMLVNRAVAEIEAHWQTSRDAPDVAPSPESGPLARARGPADPDSFSVEFLPVVAFEALFLAAYGLGDILVAEDPYLLEVYLTEPSACFCRLTLVPEAGGSLVTVEVSPAAESSGAPSPASGSGRAPEPAAVIDVLVAELNTLLTQ